MFGQWFLIPIFWNKCLSGSFHDSSFRCFSLSSFVFRGMRPQNEAMARSTAVMTSFPPRNGRWEARCYADSPSSAARCFFPHGYWIVLGLFKVFFVIFPMDNSPFGSIWGVYKDICFTFWGPRKQIWIFVEQVYWISQDLWIQESLLKTYAFFFAPSQTHQQGAFVKNQPSLRRSKKIEKPVFTYQIGINRFRCPMPPYATICHHGYNMVQPDASTSTHATAIRKRSQSLSDDLLTLDSWQIPMVRPLGSQPLEESQAPGVGSGWNRYAGYELSILSVKPVSLKAAPCFSTHMAVQFNVAYGSYGLETLGSLSSSWVC